MRGLSKNFMNDLKYDKLKNFLTSVKEDDTLSLEIRNNYINIYYRGGNIFRIENCPSGYKVHFDINYCSKYKDKISKKVSNLHNMTTTYSTTNDMSYVQYIHETIR